MFVSIRVKLFVAILLANSAMVLVLLIASALSFNRSFDQYIRGQEAARLQPLAEGIAALYEREQNWAWLDASNSAWRRLVLQTMSPRQFREADRPAQPNRPSANNFDTPMLPASFLENFILVDARTGERLMGRPPRSGDRPAWIPIELASTGEVIAQLGFEPARRLDADIDKLFQQRQYNQLIVTAAMGLLAAAAAAFPFSGWLVKPIRRMTGAVRQLTDGDLKASVTHRANDELGQLAQDFNRMASVLDKNSQDRQQWVSDIAHELRTPIALLQADIEAAQDGIRAPDLDWLRYMHQHAVRLARLVNDLNQLSQSDVGTMSYRFEPMDFGELLSEILASWQASFDKAHLAIRWHVQTTPLQVRGDDKRLAQAINNLLENSLNYTAGETDRPGQVDIQVSADADSMIMTLQDSSPGVRESDLTKLFDRLYRVDASRSRETGGSGLGLAIVRNIIEAHEGTVEARQSELGGVKIIVRLPRIVG